ncbi:MAG TPA: fimbria/pilus outer membrane usher protein [Dyella sp.]|uniref:fimbria/pilus outer membrane usher protein n=1 Tax=Dyella sp. TaxID=1869338 RepID=UPI002C025756|nr:fimbria/pilus outer membrane usher protein [Dyella sp.]HTV84929.1 fimbria/pilus outer membrane usher protein [Dyella sp.]
MIIGRASRQSSQTWHVACRRALLCAGIATALMSWAGVSRAAAANGADASASPAATGGSDASASGGSVDFDRNLLSGSGQNTTDLSRFEHGNPTPAGNYNSDVYLNGGWVARGNIRLASASVKESAVPCVDDKLLDMLGLHPAKLSDATLAQLKDPTACVSINDVIQGATMSFDMTELRLDVSVPQAYMNQMPRGYVSPEYWDAGVPAAILNYNFDSYRSTNDGQSQTTSYLGLNSGLNLGPWHLREDATVNWVSATPSTPARRQWQNIETYIQRDLPSMRALLTIGDSYTDGAVFDSYGIRGVQLGTDDRMLPQSLQGYAPIIRGVANTNARVTVRQNGVQIYQTTVAPGPFQISDLYPTGYGGSLDVTVTEADGHVTTYSVPYASVAQLLRPGITRFDIAVGQLRDATISDKPDVVQATVQHGFNNLLTGYAGLVGSQGYVAALIGTAIDTRFGALAVDLTQANTHIPGYSNQSGQSMRITYSKIIPSTNTTLSVAAYRYSTGGFFSLTQAAQARDYVRQGINAFDYVPPSTVPTIDGVPEVSVLTPAQQAALNGSAFTTNPILSATGVERQRNNFTLSLSQRLGQNGGSIYTNLTASDYWNSNHPSTQFQVGYNNHFHRLNFGISATRSVDPTGRYDNEFFLNFSLPLGDSPHAPTFMLNLTHDQTTGSQDQAIVNGTLGSINQFNYGATATHSSDGGGNSGSVNVGYRSPYAVFNASYSDGSGFSQASVGATGVIVAHPGGVTFGQPTGDTIGIVYVPGASGAQLQNAPGARVDHFGYAVVPYLTPYNLNTVQIDPKGLPLDVQLDATSAQVAPYEGAVVILKFKTENGRALIVHATMENGEPLPFGAEVFNEKGTSLGVVGQGGQILVRGVNQAGQLSVRWDDNGEAQSCSFTYKLGPRVKGKKVNAYQEIQATCTRTNAVAQVTRNGT